jgi:hypothetical protein
VSLMLSSRSEWSMKFTISSSWMPAYCDKGRLKSLLSSCSIKYSIEHFGFVVKEKRCGWISLKVCPWFFQVSVQNDKVSPLFGLQVTIIWNFLKSPITSFHQKDPTGLLMWGVWLLAYKLDQVNWTQGMSHFL